MRIVEPYSYGIHFMQITRKVILSPKRPLKRTDHSSRKPSQDSLETIAQLAEPVS